MAISRRTKSLNKIARYVKKQIGQKVVITKNTPQITHIMTKTQKVVKC